MRRIVKSLPYWPYSALYLLARPVGNVALRASDVGIFAPMNGATRGLFEAYKMVALELAEET
jgi:hypothetical protein